MTPPTSNPVQSTQPMIDDAFHAFLCDLQNAWANNGGKYQVGHGDLVCLEEAYSECAYIKTRIAELESNERAYEEIIGPMTYREVADDLTQIAIAMDILSEIPGDTLEERLRAFVAMSSALEVEWRKLNDRRET